MINYPCQLGLSPMLLHWLFGKIRNNVVRTSHFYSFISDFKWFYLAFVQLSFNEALFISCDFVQVAFQSKVFLEILGAALVLFSPSHEADPLQVSNIAVSMCNFCWSQIILKASQENKPFFYNFHIKDVLISKGLHFGENQQALGSSDILPLTITHLLILHYIHIKSN